MMIMTPLDHIRYKELWNNYGWNQTLDFDRMLANIPDFFNFLRDSRLLYAIRGYQSSFQQNGTVNDLQTGLRLDADGHPQIFKQGQWTRWEAIRGELDYHEGKGAIVSRDNSNIEWNYIYPQGLVPERRVNNIRPVYQLSAAEMDRLVSSTDKNCLVQIFSTEVGLLKRISHVGLRLIDQAGQMYSFSFETPRDEESPESGLGNLLSTYNVNITSPDFKEFQEFDNRRVTTIPRTAAQFNKMLDRLRHYATVPLRFNFSHQNCATFIGDILQAGEIKTDFTTSVAGFFWDISQDIPVLGHIVRVIHTVVSAIFKALDYITPNFIQKPVLFIVRVLTYIPTKILTILRNLLIILPLGATKVSAELKPGAEDKWDNSERLTSFRRHMDSCLDIFSDDLGKVWSTGEIVKWQLGKMAKETKIYPYGGSPSFVIAPLTA